MAAARWLTCLRCRCGVCVVRKILNSDYLNSEADDRPLNAEAMTIMRYATVADLKADCDEISALYASLTETERARMVLLMFGPEA